MFSESSPCLVGQHGSCSTAQQPVELLENISQNLCNKLPPQTVFAAPDCIEPQYCKIFGYCNKSVIVTLLSFKTLSQYPIITVSCFKIRQVFSFQLLFKRQLSRVQWFSLLLVTVGCMVQKMDLSHMPIYR